MTGDPTLEYMAAFVDLAERLSIVALLLIIAVAFLKQWVVPKATSNDLVQPYKDLASKLGNGMDSKLDQVVSSNEDTAHAINRLAETIERMTAEQQTSRLKMVEKVGELATMLVAQSGVVQQAAKAAEIAAKAAGVASRRRKS